MTLHNGSIWPRRRFLFAGASLWLGVSKSKGKTDAGSNPVLRWNEAFIRWVRAQTPPPALTARNLAILHLALWRAASQAARNDAAGTAVPAALNASGHEICLALFPSQRAEIDALQDQISGAGQPGKAIPENTEAARRTSREVLESRAADGSSTTVHYVPNDEPGQWRRTPPAMRPPELPHWGKVMPFLLKSADQFRPPAPPDITGPAFADDLRELREFGGSDSAKRTEKETETARFWSDFSYTTSPPGHWNDIASELAARLGIMESARLFALLNLALADAGIATWECKYRYNFWRPVTALNREGAPKWQPLLATPPHPEYVSGHSTFSGAAVAVLEHFFGTDKLNFSVVSDTVKNVTRRYTSLKACAEEISRSRVLGGIHFPSACREGLILGRKVGEWCVKSMPKP